MKTYERNVKSLFCECGETAYFASLPGVVRTCPKIYSCIALSMQQYILSGTVPKLDHVLHTSKQGMYSVCCSSKHQMDDTNTSSSNCAQWIPRISNHATHESRSSSGSNYASRAHPFQQLIVALALNAFIVEVCPIGTAQVHQVWTHSTMHHVVSSLFLCQPAQFTAGLRDQLPQNPINMVSLSGSSM